ncbi:hypothetical protein ABIC63_001093 [Pseudacidovorax sp. 1753]
MATGASAPGGIAHKDGPRAVLFLWCGNRPAGLSSNCKTMLRGIAHGAPSSFSPVAMMKPYLPLLVLLGLGGSLGVQAQERIWRCGNEYTNNAADAQRRGCKVVEGGNVTVVQGTRPAGASTPSSTASPRPAGSGPRVDSPEQRARDSDARRVLEGELRRLEARQSELMKDYNNGEPEKQGSEARNYQKYLDRVAEMKAEIARNEADLASLRRELDRLPASR